MQSGGYKFHKKNFIEVNADVIIRSYLIKHMPASSLHEYYHDITRSFLVTGDHVKDIGYYLPGLC
jgi:hypothetical protein